MAPIVLTMLMLIGLSGGEREPKAARTGL